MDEYEELGGNEENLDERVEDISEEITEEPVREKRRIRTNRNKPHNTLDESEKAVGVRLFNANLELKKGEGEKF